MGTKELPKQHPFGELLSQYRLRKPGLTQKHLAELAGYDQSTLVRMCKGGKDLTGPSGRDRVLRIIDTLHNAGVLHTRDEANSLLFVALMPPLFEAQPTEAAILKRLVITDSHQTRRTNLPAALSSFVGRSAEVDAVQRLLTATRLLTLTGAGGSGKTRLAQVVAANRLLIFPDGVWYVELSSAVDNTHLLQAVANVFGLNTDASKLTNDTLIARLQHQHILLVLDNCEHLIDAVVDLTFALLRACPRLTVLATSRESLNLDGETVWRVPPMEADEAIDLFVERARSRQFEPTPAQQALVADVCRRLDNMPLSIELAAARVDTLTVEDIAQRLDDRFALLTQTRRSAVTRHQTLQSAVDWSFALLSVEEQRQFCQLSIFVGGWTLTLAEDLAEEMAMSRGAVLPLLTQLAAKSLIQIERHDGELRYAMLETLRQYGQERLLTGSFGDLSCLKLAHARVIHKWAEHMQQELRTSLTAELFARIERNFPNVHAALGWCLNASNANVNSLGADIFSKLHLFWFSSTHNQELLRWLSLAQAAATQNTSAATRGAIAMIRSNSPSISIPQCCDLLNEAQQLFEEAGDAAGEAYARGSLAALRFEMRGMDMACLDEMRAAADDAERAGAHTIARCHKFALASSTMLALKFDEALMLFEKLLAECRAAGDIHNLTRALFGYAHMLMEHFEFARALALLQEAEHVARNAPDLIFEMMSRSLVAENMRFLGDPARGAEISAGCLAFSHKHLGADADSLPIYILTKSLTDIGRFDEANKHMRGLIARWSKQQGSFAGIYFGTFDALARNASAAGRFCDAAYLFGASAGDRERSGLRRFRHNDLECEPLAARAREGMGNTAYEERFATGQADTLDQTIQFSLSFW